MRLQANIKEQILAPSRHLGPSMHRQTPKLQARMHPQSGQLSSRTRAGGSAHTCLAMRCTRGSVKYGSSLWLRLYFWNSYKFARNSSHTRKRCSCHTTMFGHKFACGDMHKAQPHPVEHWQGAWRAAQAVPEPHAHATSLQQSDSKICTSDVRPGSVHGAMQIEAHQLDGQCGAYPIIKVVVQAQQIVLIPRVSLIGKAQQLDFIQALIKVVFVVLRSPHTRPNDARPAPAALS